jgi:hypothetical protein
VNHYDPIRELFRTRKRRQSYNIDKFKKRREGFTVLRLALKFHSRARIDSKFAFSTIHAATDSSISIDEARLRIRIRIFLGLAKAYNISLNMDVLLIRGPWPILLYLTRRPTTSSSQSKSTQIGWWQEMHYGQ